MSYSDAQQQRDYIDQLREEESKKRQMIDTNGNYKYLDIGLFINEKLHQILLRIYEDNTVERLVIGNDVSELAFDQGVKDETIQNIRPLLNFRNKFTRCHIHLSYAQTIAIIIQFQLNNYKYIMQKLCNKYQLWMGQLGENIIYNFFSSKGNIQIMSLARQFQQVIYNNNQLIVPGEKTKLPFDSFTLRYRTSQKIEYNLDFKIKYDFDIFTSPIQIKYTDVQVRINDKIYSLKLLHQNDEIEKLKIGFDQKQNIYQYKVQGGDKKAFEVNIVDNSNDANNKAFLQIQNLIPTNILKYKINDQFEILENNAIIKNHTIRLLYTQQDSLQTDEFEINLI